MNLVVDGKTLQSDVPPQRINDRIMVPIRFVAENIGITIVFDGSTNTVTATKGDIEVKLEINGKAYKNQKEISIDVPAMLINGRTMVPVRFISEAFGADVVWVPATNTVNITSKAVSSSNQIAENQTGKPDYALPGYWLNMPDKRYYYLNGVAVAMCSVDNHEILGDFTGNSWQMLCMRGTFELVSIVINDPDTGKTREYGPQDYSWRQDPVVVNKQLEKAMAVALKEITRLQNFHRYNQ